ncbi:uncharacterized protein LOC134283862 [Saccostrea cucullata]|uniref:uncharacterized protein LOC134283862 n=1 Tax=Saccostrea cuccullata TaxID=36930 RepID=UPI002ED54863
MMELLGIPGDRIKVNYFVNGPSCSANVETKDRNILTRKLVWMESVDSVIGLKCNEWPEIAEEWIERSREYNWPSGDLIEKAISLGCYVVPIGGRQSISKDFEWCISFVLAERLLIRNMNSIQRFIYSVLKSIRKEIFGEFSVIISSYIIKTIILWVMEENDTSSLQPKNVIEYVQECFQKLLEFLKDDFCPNYFMRKCNLFHLKYSENEKSDLSSLVRDFVLSPNFPEILCFLQPIGNLRRSLCSVCQLSGLTGSIFNFGRELFDTLLFKYQLEEPINRFVDSIVNGSEESDANVAVKSINVILETLKANRDNFSPLLQETLTGVLSCMQIRAVCAASFHKMQTSSEPFSLEERFNVVNYLIKSANLKVENLSVSEVAQLAHVFFSFGCIQDCLHLFMLTLDSLKSTSHIKVDNVMSIFDVAASFLFHFQENKAENWLCRPVILTKLYPFEFPMLTKDIQVEMQALKIQQNVYSELLKRKLTFKVTLDPLVYICYMKFKCHRLLEDNIGSCFTLKEFGDIVHKKVSHRSIALSLLGCCLKENGRVEEAILMFYRSFLRTRRDWQHSTMWQ